MKEEKKIHSKFVRSAESIRNKYLQRRSEIFTHPSTSATGLVGVNRYRRVRSEATISEGTTPSNVVFGHQHGVTPTLNALDDIVYYDQLAIDNPIDNIWRSLFTNTAGVWRHARSTDTGNGSVAHGELDSVAPVRGEVDVALDEARALDQNYMDRVEAIAQRIEGGSHESSEGEETAFESDALRSERTGRLPFNQLTNILGRVGIDPDAEGQERQSRREDERDAMLEVEEDD